MKVELRAYSLSTQPRDNLHSNDRQGRRFRQDRRWWCSQNPVDGRGSNLANAAYHDLRLPQSGNSDVPAVASGLVSSQAFSALEARLQKTEALKAAILDGALAGFVLVDGHGRVVDWNRSAERSFGYNRAEALDRDLADLIIPPEQRKAEVGGSAHGLMGNGSEPVEWPGGGGGPACRRNPPSWRCRHHPC